MRTILGLAVFVIGAIVLVLLRSRSRETPFGPKKAFFSRSSILGVAVVTLEEAGAEPYAYIYVNADGSARELHPDEKKYLETPFHGADGARPYVKSRFDQKNGWNEINGFMRRSNLPRDAQVNPAPSENPSQPWSKEEQVRFLREKGIEVVDNGDGSFTARKANQR